MKKQPLEQRCLREYLISSGTASTATRICFNPHCSLGLTLGSSPSDSVSCGFFLGFFLSIVKYVYTVILVLSIKTRRH